MTQETNKDFSSQATIKKAQRATLDMAKDWSKSEKTVHHAVESYDDVISIDPDSLEAEEARAALLKIAEDWEKKGKKYEAIRMYKKLMANK